MKSDTWHRVGTRAAAALAALTLPIAGTAAMTTATTAAAAAAAPAAPVTAPAPHVMTIMMENTDYSQVAGSPASPYFNELAHQYADFTQAYGWHYPSLPNYLELLSGSHEGINNDCDITDPNCSNLKNPTLVQQMESAGISWRAYYEGLDTGCDQGHGSGNYPYWHNPFRYFADFAAQCSHISSTSPLLSDLSGPKAPDYNWVVPDLVGSGGDSGTMSSGDTWLSTYVPQIMNTPWYRSGGQIVILYDTGYQDSGGVGGASGGQIPMVVVSAHTAGMGVVARPVTTAGVLRSVESAYGLPYLGDAADGQNGSLGSALVGGDPTGPAPAPSFTGALLQTVKDKAPAVTGVPGSLALNGVARLAGDSTIAVGENGGGQGVVETKALGALAVPGTGNLESVACSTSTKCEAVGLAPSATDQGVLVSIVNGQPRSVTRLPSFIGLYGIACPTVATCEAVGYDNASGADAVTTITNGMAGAPVEVPGGGEWLNDISCASATKCYAAGLVNYTPSIVPVISGVPQKPLTVPNAWYLNGIGCPSVANCVAVGENSNQQGIVATLRSGKLGATEVVSGTEYLYGASCVPDGSCLLTGASSPGVNSYSVGVTVRQDASGLDSGAQIVPGTNGFGKAVCGTDLADCVAVGSTFGR